MGGLSDNLKNIPMYESSFTSRKYPVLEVIYRAESASRIRCSRSDDSDYDDVPEGEMEITDVLVEGKSVFEILREGVVSTLEDELNRMAA